MSTKQGPLNQHEYLHPHYGQDNCCLCKAEEENRQLKLILLKFGKLIKQQHALDSEIVKLVDDWDLWNWVTAENGHLSKYLSSGMMTYDLIPTRNHWNPSLRAT